MRKISPQRRTLSIEAPNPSTKAQTMPTKSVTASNAVNFCPFPCSPNRTATRLSNQFPQANATRQTPLQPEMSRAKHHVSNSSNGSHPGNQPENLPRFLFNRFFGCETVEAIVTTKESISYRQTLHIFTAPVPQYRACNYLDTNELQPIQKTGTAAVRQ